MFNSRLLQFRGLYFMIGALLGLAFIILSMGRADTNASPQFEPIYHPEQRYLILIEQFRYYGPFKDDIESNVLNLLPPETAVLATSFYITKDNLIKDVVTSVSPSGSGPWYTWSAPDGISYTVTNHRTGEAFDLGIVQDAPTQNLARDQRPRTIEWFDKLTAEGWTVESSGNGKAVLSLTRALTLEEAAALSEAAALLDPRSTRFEMHLDIAKGIVTANYRYLMTAMGTETLVQYFKLLEISNDN